MKKTITFDGRKIVIGTVESTSTPPMASTDAEIDEFEKYLRGDNADSTPPPTAEPAPPTATSSTKLPSDFLPEAAEPGPKLDLSFNTPDELIKRIFHGDDDLMGNRIMAKGAPTGIIGQGGIGKSFLLLQGAACAILGRDFLGLPTHAKGLRWLVFQAENSSRRLQRDMLYLREWLGDDWPEVCKCLTIHTLDHDIDHQLAVASDERAFERVQSAIAHYQPDVVAFDPLKDLTFGDSNKDQDMQTLCNAVSSLFRQGNPDRAAICLHHSLTGIAGAARSTGFERSSFGRGSKVFHSWARGIINISPVTEDFRELAVSCGKNNNGPEFATFGIKRDPETLIFSLNADFSLDRYESEVADRQRKKGATKKPKRQIRLDALRELAAEPLSKGDLVESIRTEFGVGQTRAYELIDEAETAKIIHRDRKTKLYVDPNAPDPAPENA